MRIQKIEKNYRLFNPEYNSFLGFHLMNRDVFYYILEEFDIIELFPEKLINKIFATIYYIF